MSKTRIHPMGEHAATAWFGQGAGPIVTMAVSDLPASLQQMPGIGTYLASSYTVGVPAHQVTMVGEYVVGRVQGATTKFYNGAIVVSSDGSLAFGDPQKKFAEHHVTGAQTYAVSALFGHVRLPH